MYLRRDGPRPLLNREGEVEIAKRIESAGDADHPRCSGLRSRSARCSTSPRRSRRTKPSWKT
ncbi:MAG: sigma-70 factor domain-containing protein [Candidatus Eisenbacteria bacterium]